MSDNKSSFHHTGKLKGKIKGTNGDVHEVFVELWASGALELTSNDYTWSYRLESSYSIEDINRDIEEAEEKIEQLKRIKEKIESE